MISKKHLKINFIHIALLLGLFACDQGNKSSEKNGAHDTVSVEKSTEILPDSSTKIFHKIPTKLADKRVYICVNNSVTDFHLKYDCPRLPECTGDFKNVTIIRAIEDYKRINCPVCSSSLDEYFEEGIGMDK